MHSHELNCSKHNKIKAHQIEDIVLTTMQMQSHATKYNKTQSSQVKPNQPHEIQ